MRKTLSIAVTLMTGALFAADTIPPLVDDVTAKSAALASLRPVIDRSGARPLARLTAPQPRNVTLVPNLQYAGTVATLDEPLRVEVPQSFGKWGMAPTSALGRIVVDGASDVRLRIDAPAGTVLWVAGSEDEDFIRFVPSSDSTWSPTTRGSEVFIAAEGSGGEMRITEFVSGTAASDANACSEDVACSTAAQGPADVANASRAIALLRFIKNGQQFVCSGGLLNDVANSRTPYVLTARHCISTPEEAASVEAVWDMRSASCGSNVLASSERTFGAKLLVASKETDVALLELSGVPSGRVFLGLDKRAPVVGARTLRVSHASGGPQTFSTGVVESTSLECPTAPRERFVYTKPTKGSISPGSSGAPLILDGLYVTGQLLGACGPDPLNPCSVANLSVDGAIAKSWPLLAPYLEPQTSGRRQAARR